MVQSQEGIQLDVRVPGPDITKVLQLEIGNNGSRTLVLIYGRGCSSAILESYLTKEGIPPKMVPSRVREGVRVASAVGEGYHVIGAGACNRFGNEFIFSGYSSEYPGGINQEHLELCKPAFPKEAYFSFMSGS